MNKYIHLPIKDILYKIKDVFLSYEPKKTDVFLLFFLAAFVTTNFVTNVMAPRIIGVTFYNFNFIAGGGIIAYTFSMYILDSVTEFYKINKSILFIFANIFSLTIAQFFFKVIMKVPSSEMFGKDANYQMVIGDFCSTYIPTMFASVMGYLINCYLLDWLREKINSFYKRLLITTVFSELAYSLIWYAFYLKGHVEFIQILKIITMNFIIKMTAQCCFLWITGKTVFYLKRFELFVNTENKLI